MPINVNAVRMPVIAGNWKMNKTPKETYSALLSLRLNVAGIKNREIVVCPSFTGLQSAIEVMKGTNISIGAQNMFYEPQGAFTGEVSGEMLKDLGVTHVILGHSERRQYFDETDEIVNKKVSAAIKNGLVPIICIGETLSQWEAGATFYVIESQLENGLMSINDAMINNSIFAYEPVWAIGTGKTATPAQAQEVHLFIRGQLADMFGQRTADMVRILYGGSVKPDNIAELMSQPDIDGALVGGASLDMDSFAKIVKYDSNRPAGR